MLQGGMEAEDTRFYKARAAPGSARGGGAGMGEAE